MAALFYLLSVALYVNARLSEKVMLRPICCLAALQFPRCWPCYGQWAKSADDFSRAIEADPNFTAAYSNREISLRKLRSEKK